MLKQKYKNRDLTAKRKSRDKKKEENTITWDHRDRVVSLLSFIVFSKLLVAKMIILKIISFNW